MIRVLYVDDEPGLLEVGRFFLEKSGLMRVETVRSTKEALFMIGSARFDAVVSDYQMPGIDGIGFLKQIRRSDEITPFILFTGKGREEVVIEALESGVDFYVQKGGDPVPQFAELGHKILQAVRKKRVIAELKRTTEYLESLIRYINAPIIVWDSTFTIQKFNRAFEVISGRLEKDLVGKPLEILFPEQDRESSMDLIRRSIGRERWETVEIPVMRADGEVRTVIWNSANIMEEGDPHRLQATIAQGVDVTPYRIALQHLAEDEERMRGICEAMPLIAFSSEIRADKSFDPDWVGGSVGEMTGYTADELQQAGAFSGLVAGEDLPAFKACLSGLRPGETASASLCIRTKSGGTLPVRMLARCPSKPGDPGTARLYGVLLDPGVPKMTDPPVTGGQGMPSPSGPREGLFSWEIDLVKGTFLLDGNLQGLPGYPGSPVLSPLGLWTHIHPDDRQAVQVAMDDLVSGKTSRYETVFRLITGDGEVRRFLDTGWVVRRDGDKTPLRVRGHLVSLDPGSAPD